MWTKILKRINNIFKAQANDTLDNLEDPVKMVKLAVAEMEISITKSTEALAKAMANFKSLQKKRDEYRLESKTWFDKATLAIKAGQEDLGKKALEKKSLADKQLEQYETMSNSSEQMVAQLQSQLEQMKLKLDEAKAKQSILSAKAQNAKAQKEIAQQLGGLSGSALGDFQKYEEKILQLEAEAESMTELNSNKLAVEKEFTQLESNIQVFSDYELIKENLIKEEKLLAEKKEQEEKEKIEKLIQQLPESKPQNQLPSSNQVNEFLNSNTDQDKQKKIDEFFK